MNPYYSSYSQAPATPSNVNKAGDPSGPGLMNFQKEKYGAHLFQKNDEGNYTCFFKDCGKQFAANFSRHISKHESEGTPLDPHIKIKPTTPPPQSPHLHSGAGMNTNSNNSNIITPIKQQQIAQPMLIPMGTPQQQIMNPYGTPTQPFGFSMGLISPQNPLSAYIDPHQQHQQQQPIINTPATRSSTKASNSGGNTPLGGMPNIDHANMMDKKGIPYQICQHPLHEKWWGTVNVLPSTEFYTRASKCKKCYIKQQQDSKKLRTQNATVGSVASSIETELAKGPLTRSSSLSMLGGSKQIYLPPSLYQMASGNPYQPHPMMRQMMGGGPQQPYGMNTSGGFPKYNGTGVSNVQYLNGVTIGIPPQSPFVPKVTEQIIFRPKLDPNYMEINRNMFERSRVILSTLIKDPRSKYFREPVDAVKLQLPDYHEIITEPMDFSTIDKRLNYQAPPPPPPNAPEQPPSTIQPYQHYSQFDKDIRLVFKNAMKFNKEDTDVYELADELEKEYEEFYEKALEDVETEAALNAELVKNICATCRREPIAYQKPINMDGTISTEHDDTKPVPLIVCDGSCLRAFHLHCLKLPLDTKGPWLCRDCAQGKPILHYDQLKNEYFYFHYEGLNTEDPEPTVHDKDEESDDTHHVNGDKEMTDISKPSTPSDHNVEVVSEIGLLDKLEKVKIRKEEEVHRMKDMYFDPIWCMWRCKSKVALKHREERQEKFFDKSKDSNSNQKPKSRVIKKKKSKKRYGF